MWNQSISKDSKDAIRIYHQILEYREKGPLELTSTFHSLGFFGLPSLEQRTYQE